MNRKYLVLAALIFVSAAGYSQKLPLFEFGPKVGVNITKIDGQPFSNEFSYGYNAGVFAALRLTNRLQFQPEVLFNQYTSKTDSSFNHIFDVHNVQNVKLNYLSIPLLLSFSPTKVLSFQAGPQFGMLLNHSESLVQNGKQAIKNGDLSMLAGAQLNIANFKVSARYVIGLNDISDVSNSNMWKNQGWQLSVGFRLL
ncbi:MAG TPA: porin family protein [Chitinophagaceae bacterium]|jgi:hypothetical protein